MKNNLSLLTSRNKTDHLLRVCIFGCGWLGFPLAKHLIQNGCEVVGTTTNPMKLDALKQAGVEAILWDATQEEDLPAIVLSCQVWVMAFPPKTKSTDGEWYWQAISHLAEQTRDQGIEKLILLSSTSVYPDTPAEVSEDDPIEEEKTGHLALFKAEKVLAQTEELKTYILRLGGLAGHDRVLARHMAGKSGIKNGLAPVNLVHLKDAVHVVALFAQADYEEGIYNVCCPEHPTRQALYTAECEKRGWPIPEFIPEGKGKVVSSSKLLKETEYQFLFPDPAHFE